MVSSGVEKSLLAGDRRERITPLLLFSCMVAASGGLLFGYEHGVSGGVISMESFLKEFYPGVYEEMKEDGKTNNYCKFNSQLLTLFTSSLYISGLFASLFASHATTRFGRRFSMRVGGVFVFAGAIIGGAAINFYMLIFSRILLGFGVGFTNQSISLYLSEMAPAKYRGAIFNFHDICLTGAILSANLVNYGSQKIPAGWGWRISLGVAALPAAFLAVGSLFIPETPTSLIQRGFDVHQVSRLLQRIRGTADVGEELDQLIVAATDAPTSVTTGLRPLRRITGRKYRPQLVMSLALPIFQQLVGINMVGFYAPVMFRTVGMKESASLLSAVVMRVTATATNLVATPLVDMVGRRVFFLVGGLELFLSLVAAGGVMAAKLGDHGNMSGEYARVLLALFCLFISGFAWSWGPLPMLVTSEIVPLEIRSAGRSIGVAAGFLFTAMMAQGMLFILCHLKWGIFFFFGGWVFVMTLFVFFFLPETKGLKLEEMERVWKGHWYWKRFVEEEEEEEFAGMIKGRS
ncbi:Hexose carrier protein HEX6 [Platanthera zijinensis]|uniref:Hexose carrier protein HEX6 n=1 Tax=Platanthera zijinensis TaxID=2320716 RepID=A0AAP0GG74_9ASPA